MDEEQSTWSKWLKIAEKKPALAVEILASTALDSTTETLSELGETVVKIGIVGVAIPLIAIKEAANAVKDTGDVVRYGIRQFKSSISSKAEEVGEAAKKLDPFNNDVFKDINENN